MNTSGSKIDDEVSFHEDEIRRAIGHLKNPEIGDDRSAIIYYGMGMDAKSIGIYYLLNGNIGDSHDRFKDASIYYVNRARKGQEFRNQLEKSYWENEPLAFRNALYCAILSDDEDVRTEVATEALAMDDSYLTEFPTTVHDFYFVQALAAVLLDKEDARQRVAHLAANLDHLRPALHAYFEALATIVEGIATADAEMTTDGLEQLLADHDGDIQGSPSGADELVCLPATALLVLAHERGLVVDIQSEYIPEIVVDTDI